MNTQEREELAAFLLQLKNAQPGIKDVEAEGLIQEACRQQPDASYLLVQRSILLGHALAKAQKEISQLQEALASSKSGDGFLGGNAWGNSPIQSVARPQTASVSNMAPSASSSSWGSSMLGTVASTAAGVVAGSFLFQGIEHLMGNHNSSGFLGAHDSATSVEHFASNGFNDTTLADNDFAGLGPEDSADPDWM